jgi:hypothetical protein
MHRRGWRSVLVALCFVILAGPAFADTRIALVIGNSAYRNITQLDNPRSDALLMAATLLATRLQADR